MYHAAARAVGNSTVETVLKIQFFRLSTWRHGSFAWHRLPLT
jgi:hypothetical protein